MAVGSRAEKHHAGDKTPRPNAEPVRAIVPPWPPRDDDLGLAAVDDIAAGLQLDRQWSLATDRGFTWWGKDLAQRVWAGPALQEDGGQLCRLHARTELVRLRGQRPGPGRRGRPRGLRDDERLRDRSHRPDGGAGGEHVDARWGSGVPAGPQEPVLAGHAARTARTEGGDAREAHSRPHRKLIPAERSNHA
jgi:hypothetical protein